MRKILRDAEISAACAGERPRVYFQQVTGYTITERKMRHALSPASHHVRQAAWRASLPSGSRGYSHTLR